MSVVVQNVEMPKSPKLRLRNRKWLYGGIAVAVVLGGVAIVLAQTGQSAALSSGQLYTVGYNNVSEQVGVSGVIQSPSQINLNFTGTSGVLKHVYVKVGDKVHAGEVLAALDDSTQQTQLLQAEAGVAQAQASEAAAVAKLQQAQEGPTSAAIAVAQSNVSKAQASLAGAKQQYTDEEALYNDSTSAQQQLVSAQNAVSEQAAAVQAAQINVQKAQLQAQQTLNGGTPEDISALQTAAAADAQALIDVQAQLALSQQNLSILASELSAAQTAQANDAAAAKTPPASQTQLNADAAAVTQAQLQYNGGQAAVDGNQTALGNAQVGLANAQKALADAQPNSTTNLAQQAAIGVQIAEASLTQAQAQYSAAQANLTVAQEVTGDKAQANQALDNVKNAVTQAQASLQGAQASLQLTQQPPDATSIAAAQASVQGAQAGVQSAQAQLSAAQVSEQNTVIKAPIDGLITQSNDTVGDVITQASPVFVLDDATASDLQMNLQVSESNIGQIKVGDAVSVTASAFPGQTYSGSVVQIYPTPQVVNNVTEYTVLATVHDARRQLRVGMTTDVEVETSAATHVLTVPAIALQQFGQVEGVYVSGLRPARTGTSRKRGSGTGSYSGKKGSATGGGGSYAGRTTGTSSGAGTSKLPQGVYFQPVQVGIFGTTDVQITKGLQAGEKILLTSPGSSAAGGASGATGSAGHSGGGGLLGGAFHGGSKG